MSSHALSEAALDRMRRALSAHVESGFVPGLVGLIACGDDVRVEALGVQSFGSPAPMRRDTIFRIASITKPITAAAAMLLVEECRVRLDDTVDHWLPELADRRVLRTIGSEFDDTVPTRRPITLRDLLTSRMGIGSVMAPPDIYPIQHAIREQRIGGDGPKLQDEWPSTDEWIGALGSLPLIAHPGEQWLYNVSLDALGVLISRVSGQTFGAFLRDRLFEPLGMRDTSFQLPREKLDRFPSFYRHESDAGALVVYDGVDDSTWLAEPRFESGSGGLLGTVDDYFTFLRMLLEKGRHDGRQILARATVELMTSDQVPPEQRRGQEMFFGGHSSWGFGMAVDLKRDEIYRNPGRFGWDGGFGTSAYADPAEDLVGIVFYQRMADSPEAPKIVTDFWTTAYTALE